MSTVLYLLNTCDHDITNFILCKYVYSVLELFIIIGGYIMIKPYLHV